MKRSVNAIFLIPGILACFSCEPETPKTGPELVEKSIRYHDPKGEWGELKATFFLNDSLPPGRDSRSYEFAVDNSKSQMSYSIEGLKYEVWSDSLVQIQGEIEKERALRMRNYYTYLWGLPMKLRDPGTLIEKEIKTEEVKGKNYLVVRVPYDMDIWYFYFDPETYKMEAYKFYKDEPNQIGEIIFLEGEIEFSKMKIPANRTWFRTENQEFLGTDMLLEIR
ncbi:DUF6503 family protein [Algoriphagus sp.]|uniref:DUF6503 family protein n=1 Tax=Algoriphagus sp. TaxID=1872435 RepID=UPI0025FB358B|nr:DUF6503 family protein [Algoriphagus sp.]